MCECKSKCECKKKIDWAKPIRLLRNIGGELIIIPARVVCTDAKMHLIGRPDLPILILFDDFDREKALFCDINGDAPYVGTVENIPSPKLKGCVYVFQSHLNLQYSIVRTQEQYGDKYNDMSIDAYKSTLLAKIEYEYDGEIK
jgi:hypothetical protein